MARKGWTRERERHALAKRGARTVQPKYINNMNMRISTSHIKYSTESMKYDSNGILLPSEGIKEWFGGIVQKTKDFGSNVSEKVKSGVGKIKDWNENKEQTKWDKDVKAGKDTKAKEVLTHKPIESSTPIKKIEEADSSGTFSSQEEADKVITYENKQKELEIIKPEDKHTKSTSLDNAKEVAADNADFEKDVEDIENTNKGGGDSLDIGGKLSSMISSLGSTENRPPSGDMNDVTEAMFTSADADSIIATSENKEKLVLYESKLKRTIDLFNTARKTKLGEYRNEETYLSKQIHIERNLAQKQLNSRIKIIKTSGMPKESAHAKIELLKNDFNTTWSNKGLVLKNMQSQHKADVNYINRISHNLDSSRHAVEKKLKQISLRK